ncbi:DUF922 domain-containing protein [Mesorhizobium sp. M0751]|uniref:DUF922 domain-containing protein n=1 Tax=unclassified Mesorhizobium TaxID=325217 RepID=UPI00333D0BE7
MPKKLLIFLVFFGLLGNSWVAEAGVKVIRKEVPYNISGSTGAELLKQMNLHGPWRNLVTTNTFQTTSKVVSKISYGVSGSACYTVRSDYNVYITMIYPRLVGQVSPALKKRWNTFLSGMMKRIENHNRLFKEMDTALNTETAKGLSFTDDPKCFRLKDFMKQRQRLITREYEASQERYNKDQMRPNGPVAQAAAALIKEP